MSEWREVKLGEFIEHKKGFAFKSKDYQKEGTLIVRVSDTTSNSINIDACAKIDFSLSENFKEYQLKENDIIIATVGSWSDNLNSVVGKVVKVPLKASGALLNQNAVRISPLEGMDNSFLFYRLKAKDFFGYIINNAQGSANQASITLKDIFNFKLMLPSLPKQKAIASVLSSLDDKIDLLHRQNETVEKMAATIFRQWFVEEAKDDWEEVKLGDIISFKKGKKPKEVSDSYIEGYLPQILIETFNTGKYIFADPEKMVISSNDDILMVMDGASSGRINFSIGGIVGSTLSIVKTDEVYKYFVYQILKINEEDIRLNSTGSSIPHADKEKILNIDIKIPNNKTLEVYTKEIKLIFDKIKINLKQVQTLTNLRDTLLPKLMSGEVKLEA